MVHVSPVHEYVVHVSPVHEYVVHVSPHITCSRVFLVLFMSMWFMLVLISLVHEYKLCGSC